MAFSPASSAKCMVLILVSALLCQCNAFSVVETTQQRQPTRLLAHSEGSFLSRRSLFQSLTVASITAAVTATQPAFAAERVPLETSLYTILRVREATQQEARLIKSGKFKDVQRANVKLAVKFMVENYQLGDAFVKASSYLETNERRVAANTAGQNAVQDLYTILEYFDSADVQNLKVSSLSSDKESVVIKGLDATRRSIDEFLGYFPKETVDSVKSKVKTENDLNFQEFDRSLGDILNPNPAV